MRKVITYGSFDLLHYGHISLLQRARGLGEYLIVGVTSDDFDKLRGKINVCQSLPERMEGIRRTGLADEIIVEEYEGQKIDDIRRYGVDIFTVGSDWAGKFDYLQAYCEVIYLPRTSGVSSTALRSRQRTLRLGLAGEGAVLSKYQKECGLVNGIQVSGVYTQSEATRAEMAEKGIFTTTSYEALLKCSDAVYLQTPPVQHAEQAEEALFRGKHVLCESPVSLTATGLERLFRAAKVRGLVLMDAVKTAYSMAYGRLLLLLKSGCIGDIVSVDAVCTSLMEAGKPLYEGGSACAWGPTAMLPIFQLLGVHYLDKTMTAWMSGRSDLFAKIDFFYPGAVASLKVGSGVKSEGELIVSGTRGYLYIPAPWWKTDYFEIRYENPAENRRYFYQLDGEGIRCELLCFLNAIEKGGPGSWIDQSVTRTVTEVLEDFYTGKGLRTIHNGKQQES